MDEVSVESMEPFSPSSDSFLQHIGSAQLEWALTPIKTSIRPALWAQMERKIKGRENTDLQVHIGDTLIHCHLLPLQCFSEYFEREVTPGQAVVVLPSQHVPAAAFRIVYDWILDPCRQLEWAHFVAVLSAAEYLQIPALVERCWQHLDNPRVVENVAFYVFLQARQFHSIQLQSMMLCRICRFFLSLTSTPEFCELSLEELSVLLSSNIVAVFEETDVFYAACQWLLYDWDERKEAVEPVMELVRFGSMRANDLARFCIYQDCDELQPILRHPATKKLVDLALASICCERPASSAPDGSGWMKGSFIAPKRIRLIADSEVTLTFVTDETNYDAFNEFLAVLRENPNTWQKFRLSEENAGLLEDMFAAYTQQT